MFFLPVVLVLLPALPARSQTLSIDLSKVAEQLEVRYYIAENGELPPDYILIGESLVPNFLKGTFDLRKKVVEYDVNYPYVFIFKYPGSYPFKKKEERRGVFYFIRGRDFDIPGLEIEIKALDELAEEIKEKSFREVWIEDVKYNLRVERKEGTRGGGLVSINIPIPMPKVLERIIGKGEETNLSVQGSEHITIGGESNWCSNCPYTEGRPKQQKFPDLDMEQKLNVSLRGTIGEKINVEIQHSSTGQGIQSTNRVRINYKGFDDEIVKLIEMGDTDLMLHGAQLISYSGAAKGLFGVKGMAQLGPLDLTVVASKEEGETASGSFTAQGGQSSKWVVADYDFIKRQFFYFETPGDDFSNPIPTFYTVHPVIGGPENDEVEVFMSLRTSEWGQSGVAEYNIKAYVDPENDGITKTENFISGRFKQLILDEDFELIQDYGSQEIRYIGIRLFYPLDSDRILAVRYKAKDDADGREIKIGDYKDFSKDTLIAELICPPYEDFGPTFESSPYPSTWNMMMRNVYSLGTSSIEEGTLDIKIEDTSNRPNRDIHEQSKISYIRLFGLDRFDKTGNLRKDNQVDNLPGILNLERGYIMFPWYEPFNPPLEVMEQLGFIDRSDSLEAKFDYSTLVRDSLIYSEPLTEQVKVNGHHYNIVVEASSGQRFFQLNAFNAFDIIEGSEVVTVDGVKLTRGVDYDIDYMSGTVTLKGSILTEMTPDSRVQIDYQHKPLIGGGKSSLVGIGANLNLSSNSRINATFLYNSTGAPKYAPRLGEEPSRMMAADVNGNFKFSPKWMTSMMNLLPLVDTDAKSTLNISGEIAVSMPNPNLKGEAFIDDMEGIEDSDVISMIRRVWYESSPPIDPDTEMRLSPSDATEFYWYNASRTPQQGFLISTKQDLNPRLDDRENSSITSLFIKAVDPQPGEWCGVMTGFPGGGLDLTTAQYLEIWVNDYDTSMVNRGGTLHIDFGKIDEDFYKPNENMLNDEDKPPYTWTSDEDTGFEGETCTYPKRLDESTWDDALGIFTGINCRGENGIHDSEDLNKNGRLDTINAYYTLELNLAQSAFIDVQRDYPKDKYAEYWNKDENNKNKAWRMYRLDLSKAKLVSPTGAKPRWDAIQHLRIWIESPDSLRGLRGHMIEIAGLKFVGSKWQYNGIRDISDNIIPNPPLDEKITFGTINNKDNPARYEPPYTVQREEGIENKEQSLLLKFENFYENTSFKAFKRFYGNGMNFQQYRQVQFFVRADENAVNCSFFVQIAYDSLNYYEIEVPFSEHDKNTWLWVVVNLGDLTNMKIGASDTVTTETISDVVDPSRKYIARLLGNPTLFQVRYIYIGLRNKSGEVIPRGEVWFNDLKLGDVRKDIDHAERASINANFANIVQFTAGWQRTGPEFRSLQQKSGSGVENSSLSISGKTNLQHVIPTGGFDIPVSFRYNNSKSLPKYIPQSDVEIEEEAVRDSLKSISNNYSFSVSLSRRNSKNWLMKNLFDNLKTSFNYSKRSTFSPYTRDTTWTMGGNLNYQVHFKKDRQISLFRGIKWRYWLTNFSLQSSASRKLRRSMSYSGEGFVRRPYEYSANWKNNLSSTYEPFESIKLDFNMSEDRNLAIDHYFHSIPIGVQTRFGHTMRMRFHPMRSLPFLEDLRPNIEVSTRYNEDINPNLRQEDDPFGTRNVNAQRNMNIAFDFDIGEYMLKIGELIKLIERSEVEEAQKRAPYRQPGRRAARSRKEFFERQRTHKPPSSKKGEIIRIPDESVKGGEKPVTPEEVTKEEEKKETPVSKLGIQKTVFEEKKKPEEKKVEGKKPEEAKADTTTATKEARKKPDPWEIFRQLFRLLGKIEVVRTNINISHQNSYQRLYDRANLAYQFGFTSEAGVEGKSGDIERKPDRASDNLTIDLRSGINISSNADLLFNYNFLKRKDDHAGRISESNLITWPSVSFSLSGLEKIRLFKNTFERSDLKLNFERKRKTDVRGKETSYSLSPIWSIVWKNSLSSNISFTYNQTSSIQNNQDIWSKNWSVAVNLKYSVRGDKGLGLPLPFLKSKRLKFSSTLNTSLDLSYSSSSKYNQPPAQTISISPRASYKFSNRLTGSMYFMYKRTSGGQLGYIYNSVGLGVSAEFRF